MVYHRICILLMILCTPLLADDAQLFQQAIEAQKKELYKEAYLLYCQISKKSAVTFLHMGNCAFHEKNNVAAVALWRKAINEGNADIQRAAYKGMSTIKEKHVPLEDRGHPFVRFWHRKIENQILNVESVPLIISQFVAILSLLVFLVLLIIGKIDIKNMRKKDFASVFLAVILTCISIGIYRMRTGLEYAVIAKKDVIRSGGGLYFEPLKEVYPCTEVVIIRKTPLWTKMRFRETVGWISTASLYEYKEGCCDDISLDKNN